jgi:hypothetical protein
MSTPPGDFPADKLGQELLSEAGQRDAVNLDSIRELLRKGADVNYRGNIGETPLMVAAVNLELDLIRLLLEKGADKTIRSDPGGDFANKNALELARDALMSDPDYADGPEIIRLLSDPVAPPGGEPAGGAKKKKKKGSRSVRNKRRTGKKRARKTRKSRK